MDLYEALKSGTPADELVATFNKELEAAKAKLKEETEAERMLSYHRSCLADAIYDYISALTGAETLSFTIPEIEKELKKQDTNPHELKQEYLKSGEKISHFDIYRDSNSGQLALFEKSSNTLAYLTDYYIE